MNVILQALVHNPLLRLHYLSDKHNQHLCGNKREGKVCIACEMDSLFTNVGFLAYQTTMILIQFWFQFYSNQITPFAPTSFIFSIWKCNSSLATYAQHDAHEFFMAVLNEVHANCNGASINNEILQLTDTLIF
jgi:ubiquitin carboxyl-terminal hydrolase 22/27/51